MSELLQVPGNMITIIKIRSEPYLSLTDIARIKNATEPKSAIQNWMRNKDVIAFLGVWEQLNNPNFKGVEFDAFKSEAGFNAFTMSPQKRIEGVNAIGIVSKSGRYGGGSFAHIDIALEFASWISPEFRLYIVKEFQRLKGLEQMRGNPHWTINRVLSKINYKTHTLAIKEHLIDGKISDKKAEYYTYADEADMLNIIIFGKTNKQWRDETGIQTKERNIRDNATITELIVLSNIEFLNAQLVETGLSQAERFNILKKTAQKQFNNVVHNQHNLEELVALEHKIQKNK